MGESPTVAAVVVAAGRGRRFGDALPKQYHALAGRPVLRHAVESLIGHPSVAEVLVVIGPDDRSLHDVALGGLDVLAPVTGGDTRQQSVLRGLEALAGSGRAPDAVLIHDGARPLLDRPVIDRLVGSLRAGRAAIAAVPVTDTLKRGDGQDIAATVDRTALWRAQTPQAFPFAAILAAHRAAATVGDLTDDAAVAERAGMTVALVLGDEDNLKVTTVEDLRRAERILAARRAGAAHATAGATAGAELRVGKGFDVHAFEPGDTVFLCGVPVPHKAKLAGHSDADVALHALTDALLGAIAAGDIGKHFPPGEPRWRGADSAQFLRHAADLVAARGGRIVNVDVTIICERPKVGPHRDRMQARIAEILQVEVDRVSVKATTTERLGFTGREEGIAAEAIALVAV